MSIRPIQLHTLNGNKFFTLDFEGSEKSSSLCLGDKIGRFIASKAKPSFVKFTKTHLQKISQAKSKSLSSRKHKSEEKSNERQKNYIKLPKTNQISLVSPPTEYFLHSLGKQQQIKERKQQNPFQENYKNKLKLTDRGRKKYRFNSYSSPKSQYLKQDPRIDLVIQDNFKGNKIKFISPKQKDRYN